MKTKKLVFALCFLFIAGLTIAQAPMGQRGGQQGPPPVPDSDQIEKMVNEMSDDLLLDKKQERKFMQIYTKHFEEVKAKMSGNSRPKREEMKAMKKELENEVSTLLTKEQQKKYKAFLKQQEKGQRKGRREKR